MGLVEGVSGGRWVAGGKILGEIEYYVSLVLGDGYE